MHLSVGFYFSSRLFLMAVLLTSTAYGDANIEGLVKKKKKHITVSVAKLAICSLDLATFQMAQVIIVDQPD